MFFATPWAASGDITLAEELFWSAEKQPDVVLMGDSRTGNGLNPAVIEEVLAERGRQSTVVNIWLAGAGPVEFRTVVERVLSAHPPQVVICNINENSLSEQASHDGTPTWDQQLREVWGAPDVSRLTWDLHRASGSLHWGAFVQRAGYNMLFAIARGRGMLPQSRADGLRQRRGYLPRFGQLSDQRLAAQAATDGRRYQGLEVSERGATRLRAFLRAARSARLKLVVVLLPVNPALVKLFPKERYQRFVDFVARTTRECQIPFVNLYASPAVPRDGYYDAHHLNDRGADIVSRVVAGSIIVPALRDWDGPRVSSARSQ